MLTTGLLTLSVHDSLTFDGTEIALHPDLFGGVGRGTTGGRGGSSIVSNMGGTISHGLSASVPPVSASSSVVASLTTNTVVGGSVTGGNSVIGMNGGAGGGVVGTTGPAHVVSHQRVQSLTSTTGSSLLNVQTPAMSVGGSLWDDGMNSKTISGQNSIGTRLEVGDMIEIRVWDAKPGLNPSSRPQHSPPLPRHGGQYSESSSSVVVTQSLQASASTSTTGNDAIRISSSGTAASPQQSSSPQSAMSLQYSVDSPADTSFQTAVTSASKLVSRRDNDTKSDGVGLRTADPNEAAKSKREHSAGTAAVHEKSGNVIVVPAVPGSLLNTPSVATKPAAEKNAARELPPPPLFGGRSRTNSSETTPVPRAAGSGKPPPASRSRTYTLPAGTEAAEQAARERRWASTGVATAGRPHNLHTRDISDLTAVTLTPIPDGSSGLNVVGPTGLTMPTLSADDVEQGGAGAEQDPISRISETHGMRISFFMLVTEKTLTSIKGTAKSQISLLRQVADLYNLSSFDMVTVTKIEKGDEASVLDAVSADFVTVTIKDQFVSRGEMHHFQESLVGRWIYEGERLSQTTSDGVRAVAKEIRHGEKAAKSGIITNDTKITFRSRSARFIWLVQISSEMWDYSSPYEAEEGGFGSTGREDDSSCEIYFDKFISFMYRLFKKWKELDVTHSLTVVFFSRTFLGSQRGSANSAKNAAFSVDVDGRLYQDHFKPIIENETRADWDSLVLRIKKAFITYPFEVGWNLEQGKVPSTAAQGNILEAINVTLNCLQFHYLDRDLHRTGNSIVIVSPGCGVFEVDKSLAGITKQRMMDNGIGSDMLSLGLPPLHIAPFFLYKELSGAHAEETHGFDDWKTYFEIPHWMHLSFVSYDNEGNNNSKDHYESKSNVVSGAVSTSHLDDPVRHVQVAANGFLVGGLGESEQRVDASHSVSEERPVVPPSPVKVPGFTPSQSGSKGASISQIHQRYLISEREFEDILEACRPRTRGESITGMPSPLSSLLYTWDVSASKRSSLRDGGFSRGQRYHRGSDEKDDATPALRHHSSQETFFLKEWGEVNFDIFGGKTRPPKIASCQTLVDSVCPLMTTTTHDLSGPDSNGSDKSSPSSSFTSNYSNLLARSYERGNVPVGPRLSPGLSGIHIQPSISLEMTLSSPASGGGDTNMARAKRSGSEDSLSTIGTEDYGRPPDGITSKDSNLPAASEGSTSLCDNNSQKRSASAESLRNLMSKYDSNVFAPPPRTDRKSNEVVSSGGAPLSNAVSPFVELPHGRISNPPAQSRRSTGGLSALENVSSVFSAGVPSVSQPVGGIGAALIQFNNSGDHVAGHREPGTVKKILSARRLKGMDTYIPITGSSYDQGQDTGIRTSANSMSSLGMPLSSDPPDRLYLQQHHLAPPSNSFAFPGGVLSESKIVPGGDGTRGTFGAMGQHHIPRGGVHSGDTPYRAGQTQFPYIPHPKNQMGNPPERGARDKNNPHLAHSPSQQGSRSPPRRTFHHHGHGNRGKSKKRHHRRGHHTSSSRAATPPMPNPPRRKPWVLNPFRQQDEEEVLAKRTHNRRRWSHVFPPGEIEFKKHSGPNWKSLCQPAILPLTIDFHPSPQELHDPAKFQFSFYEVTIGAVDRSYYTSHSELITEMVRQRLVQDYQIVPQSLLKESARRGEAERQAKQNVQTSDRVPRFVQRNQAFSFAPTPPRISNSHDNDGNIKHALSMGHRIHELTYNPSRGTIEVVQYYATFAQNIADPVNIQTYRYMLWSDTNQQYVKVAQTFEKYSKVYRWNKVDNMICGDPDKTMTAGTRYRQLVFGIIPDKIVHLSKEQEYVNKFQRLVEYLTRLQQKESTRKIEVKIVMGAHSDPDGGTESNGARKGALDSVIRFVVQLRKGQRDKYEWMEIVIDSSFDPRRTYRIMINWLVASANKVEAQIQLLQRRCTQYGLNLVSFSQISIAGNIYIHPFKAGPMLAVRNKEKASAIESDLVDVFNYVNDGVHFMASMDAKYIDDINDFEFPVDRRGRRKNIPARQYVHRSGTLFVRLLRDEKGWVLFVVFENGLHNHGDEEKKRTARALFRDLHVHVTSVVGKDEK